MSEKLPTAKPARVPPSSSGVGWFDRTLLRLPIIGMSATDVWMARKSDAREAKALELLHDLSAKKGISTPQLLIYEGPPNAASVNPTGSIAVSRSLLEQSSDRELNVTLAHELSHHVHRSRDLFGTLGGLAVLDIAYDYLVRPAMSAKWPRLLPQHGSWKEIGAKFFAGLGIVTAIARNNEYEADYEAAKLTGDPAALAHLLDERAETRRHRKEEKKQRWREKCAKMPGWQEMIVGTGSEILSPFWELIKSPFAAHPPSEDRIAVLNAMEREQQSPTASVPISPATKSHVDRYQLAKQNHEQPTVSL